MCNYWESISDFSVAIKIDLNDSFLYFWRGCIYESLKEFPKTVNDLKIAQHLDPEFGFTKSLLDYLEEKDFWIISHIELHLLIFRKQIIANST